MPDPLFDIQGQSIVIAGAASGLGRALAHALAERGAQIMLGDLSAEGLAAVSSELGSQPATCVADIADEGGADALIQAAADRFGRIDGVINTAGLLHIAPAIDLDPALFRQTLDVNVTGAFLLSRAAARRMGDGGGRIVHLASVSSLVANPDYAAYATSKAALSQLVRVLAREWAPRGIAVNAIGPAMTETGMTQGLLSDRQFRAQAMASIPMGRFGTPQDLIGMVVLLLAPAGAFITGQTIYVDGGRTLT
jgi:NAD(P)-dependent dehydrogenase (short-subunit alcohol dehydrogenase family)